MVVVFLVLLLMILERTSIEIAWPFGVPITLELKEVQQKRGQGTEKTTHPHGSLDDSDDIIRAILVETRATLLVVKDDDGDVDGAEDAELIGFFEETVLSLWEVRDKNTRDGSGQTLRKVTDLFLSCWGRVRTRAGRERAHAQ